MQKKKISLGIIVLNFIISPLQSFNFLDKQQMPEQPIKKQLVTEETLQVPKTNSIEALKEQIREETYAKKDEKHGVFDSIKPEKVRGLFRKFFVDSYCMWEKFFRLKTMKMLSAVVPFYLIGRKADAVVHRQFYDAQNHKNINQPPKWLRTMLTDEAMAVPFLLYGMYHWFNSDPYKRRTAQVFSVGLFWTWSTKIVLKQIKTDSGLRPWHEEYSRHEQTHGGSPSGHTSMATFMATYLWLTKGPKYGIPLSIYAGMVAGLSTAGNHHYVSQVVAGAGLGAIMAVAAYDALEELILPKDLEIGLASDRRGGLGVQIAYNF